MADVGRCDAFGVFGTALQEKIGVFHPSSLKMLPKTTINYNTINIVGIVLVILFGITVVICKRAMQPKAHEDAEPVCRNIHRCPMPPTSLECQASELGQ